jgi:hypothetical protein
MIEWSESFGDTPIYIHSFDRRWVVNPSKSIVFWEGGSSETPVPGMTLVDLGGHFRRILGSPLVPRCRRKRDLVFRRLESRSSRIGGGLSFMYSYPNLIPLPKRKIRQIEQKDNRVQVRAYLQSLRRP